AVGVLAVAQLHGIEGAVIRAVRGAFLATLVVIGLVFQSDQHMLKHLRVLGFAGIPGPGFHLGRRFATAQALVHFARQLSRALAVVPGPPQPIWQGAVVLGTRPGFRL